MVTKKQLKAEIDNLKGELELMKKCLQGLNTKIARHIKEEKQAEEETDKIAEWLKDERIDDVQEFINKGNKI